MKNSEQKFVFRDVSEILGKAGAEKKDFDARCMLLASLGEFIRNSDMTQAQIAEILEVAQPRVSDLARGKISKFSLSSLIEFLWKLDFDVSIKVNSPKKSVDSVLKKKKTPSVKAKSKAKYPEIEFA